MLSACAALLLACNPPPPESGNYDTRIEAMRAATNEQFQKSSDPVPDSRKARLLPLEYYPIDPAYNVPAELKPSNDPTIFEMPTSTGVPRKERRAGTLQFTLQGQPLTLTAFVEADAQNLNRLFVPFSDTTSGKETYPAGRYIDLSRTPTGLYELDFNRAYNPYCYYNESYECPLPPSENKLKVPIQAGEKVKK
jgi:uncharacterized protein (DUF1684 family)